MRDYEYGPAITVFAMVAFFVTLIACEQTVKPRESSAVLRDVAYKWDLAHELCFAQVNSMNGHFGTVVSITYVPLRREDCR